LGSKIIFLFFIAFIEQDKMNLLA